MTMLNTGSYSALNVHTFHLHLYIYIYIYNVHVCTYIVLMHGMTNLLDVIADMSRG